MPKTGFFAYPSKPHLVEESIKDGVGRLSPSDLSITLWPSLDILGLKIDNLIRERIESSDILLADVTYPNFNVYYEMGYAVGFRKALLPTVNTSVDKANENVNLTGILDTIGQLKYENGAELLKALQSANPADWAQHYIRDKNHTQPLFILDTLKKTEFRNYVFHAAAASKIEHRIFDPAENSRLSLTTAIGEISSSSGVIIPLLSTEIADSYVHNLRAAFLAGLCHGFGIECLIIQYEDAPAPLDYRDFIETVSSRHDTTKEVEEFCQSTLIRNQRRVSVLNRKKKSILDKIDVGASASENEIGKLGAYFIRTAQFQRALRADSSIVTGRKGAGKSAIFFQLVEEKEKRKENVIVELRPASHSLSELRQELLSVVNAGVFDHTIAAFWQYIIYAEIMLKIRETLLPKARYSMEVLKQISELSEKFHLSDEMVSGDFTSRLEIAVRSLLHGLKTSPDKRDQKETLTNILFEKDIPNYRDAIVSLADDKNIILLLDDLDKGWPARQVERHDIHTIKHLIDALTKIQRDLNRKDVSFQHFLFIRSDVYENLVEETSDRGKYNIINVDWSDPAQLERLVQERVAANLGESSIEAWNAVNPLLADGRNAILHMINSSLMRPRFLIELCEKAISFAINRGHKSVTAQDVEDALQQQSLYLVSDFGYEIRDVTGLSEGIFYRFLGKGDTFTHEELQDILNLGDGEISADKAIELLIWYGFLGIPSADGRAIFIYNRDYDMRRLEAERQSLGENLLYVVNPAFLRGLKH